MTEQVLRKCLSSSISSVMCELVVLGGWGGVSLIIISSSLKKWQERVEFVGASLITHSKYPHVSLLESHAASLMASHACIKLSPNLSLTPDVLSDALQNSGEGAEGGDRGEEQAAAGYQQESTGTA